MMKTLAGFILTDFCVFPLSAGTKTISRIILVSVCAALLFSPSLCVLFFLLLWIYVLFFFSVICSLLFAPYTLFLPTVLPFSLFPGLFLVFFFFSGFFVFVDSAPPFLLFFSPVVPRFSFLQSPCDLSFSGFYSQRTIRFFQPLIASVMVAVGVR